MYGIVNKGIEDMVKTNFGSDVWDRVLATSGVDIDFFISNQPYDDDITFKLTTAVAKEINIPLEKVMEAFGEWWVLKTGMEKYGGMMKAGGNNLREFLINLPIFHNRIMLIYPKLTPPEFKISDVADNSVYVHYFSKRQGLQEFVRGLLKGLGIMYNTPVEVELLQSRNEGNKHETFKVSWK
jgi:Haem-NO-binding